mgnify:CR=1 FL=1
MRTTSILFALASSLLLSAQGRESIEQTDTGTVVLHYFTTGQLSTKAWTDADGRWGHSWAYDRSGRVIFDRQTRTVGGHASVTYSYHPNGAVSKAEVSDAPDGGIQWYRSTTTFDVEGLQTGFTEQGMGNQGPIPGVGTGVDRKPETLKPVKQEVVEEQRMFTSEYFVVATKRCHVHLHPEQTSPASPEIDGIQSKGDTLRGGAYSMGEQWEDPLKHVNVTVTSRNGKRAFKVLRVDTVQVAEDHRRYYVVTGK